MSDALGLAGRVPATGGAPPSPQLPPVLAANQIALRMNVADIAITLGHVRQIIDPATGGPGERAAIEWLLTVVLSAPAARMLHEGLGGAIAEYEKRFGAIPRDPNQRITPHTAPTG